MLSKSISIKYIQLPVSTYYEDKMYYKRKLILFLIELNIDTKIWQKSGKKEKATIPNDCRPSRKLKG